MSVILKKININDVCINKKNKTMMHQDENSKISRNALLTFTSLGLATYLIALSYCYVTEHLLGMTLIGVAGIFVAIFAATTYRKL